MIDHDNEIEQILLRYRPAEPPERLRSRVLSSALPGLTQAGVWRVRAFRVAVAAVVLIAVGLRLTPLICLMAAIFATPGKGF